MLFFADSSTGTNSIKASFQKLKAMQGFCNLYSFDVK